MSAQSGRPQSAGAGEARGCERGAPPERRCSGFSRGALGRGSRGARFPDTVCRRRRTEAVTWRARPVRDPEAESPELGGLEVVGQGSRSARRAPDASARCSARPQLISARKAAARVRSAGRGRGHREGALTAAGPTGTPPAGLPAPPEIWGGGGGGS